MQPAFVPPASYFRLFAASDMMVMLDDVQFNRRWYTHRQRMTRKDGVQDWLTLPIKRTDREMTMINHLQWGDDSVPRWAEQIRRFPVFSMRPYNITLLQTLWASAFLMPLHAVLRTLESACLALGLSTPVVMASDLNLNPALRGQDRILAICEHFKAKSYVNSPGGCYLYDSIDFARRGVRLEFLPPYDGSMKSIIERLGRERALDIKKEIMENI